MFPLRALAGSAASVLISASQTLAVPGEREPLRGSGVLVEGGLVSAVGRTAELVAAYPEVEHIEFPGATIMPGLVNAHVHLSFDVSTDPRPALEARDFPTVRATIAANAAAALDGGVTTVRDLGDLDGLVSEYRREPGEGRSPRPRILTAGSPLTPPQGHCWFLGGEINLNETDGRGARRAIREAVTSRAAAGADVIKVMASGGNLTPSGAPMWKSQFSLEGLATIVEIAHELGLPVAGHAHGTDAMALCARAGVDTIEHGSWRDQPGPDGRLSYDASEDVAELIANSGAVIVPTRSRGWRTWPAEAQLDLQLQQLAWAADHGIKMIAGNDAGVGQGHFDDLVDAITLFGEAGWSKTNALATATTRAASTIGGATGIGTIEPGGPADLLVIDGDPLQDLRALSDRQLVVVGGQPHWPGGSQLN